MQLPGRFLDLKGKAKGAGTVHGLLEIGHCPVQELVGQGMHKLGCKPDRILCSPRVRAVQTADITAQALQVDFDVEKMDFLDGGYAVDTLVDYFQSCIRDNKILCVGHEPDMSTWTAALLKPGLSNGIHFGTSSIASIHFAACPELQKGELGFFYCKEDLL